MPDMLRLDVYATLLAAAIGSACVAHLRAPIPGQGIGGKCLPILPPAVERALHEHEPTFEFWTPTEGPCSAVRYGVTGDFNSDGRVDVALNGHTSRDALILIVLSRPAGYEVDIFRQAELVHPDGSTENWAEYTLGSVKPGTYQPTCDGVNDKLHLRADAFWIDIEGKSSSIVYYDDGRFRSFPYGTC